LRFCWSLPLATESTRCFPALAQRQNFSVSQVTDTGKNTCVAISPDGKNILSVLADNGQQSLRLRNIPTNSNTEVVIPGPVNYLGLRFSPDGNYLYFVRNEVGSSSLENLYRAPVLGGTPENLIIDVDTNESFSPDGKKIVYMTANSPRTRGVPGHDSLSGIRRRKTARHRSG
jgi:eukaryotic-like serine/threonine-protein kinase